jgi:hypothetical protein
MTVNEGLFLSPSHFPDPISKNGVYTSQDISKNQIITFYQGRLVRDCDLPERPMLNVARLLLGSAKSSIHTLYLLGDEKEDGTRLTSDSESLVESEGIGAGGFIKDCINLERMIKSRGRVEDDSVEEIIVEGGGDGEDVIGSNDSSYDDDDDDDADPGQFISINSYCDQFRLRVKDPESEGEMRSCINVALRVYDEQYNELIRDKVSASLGNTAYLRLLDPTKTIVVIEALRTIRAGEELFMAYSDTLWEEYLGWRKVPKILPYPNTSIPTPDPTLAKQLSDSIKHQPFIFRVPFVEGITDPYEPLDDEVEEEEEEEEDSQGMIVIGEEEDGDSYDDLIEEYEQKLVSMESFSSGSKSVKKDAMEEVKRLIGLFKTLLEKAVDSEETALLLYNEFVEIMVRMNMLEDDEETLYYSAEQLIGIENTPITLKQLREELIKVQRGDIINRSEKPSPKIAEINEKRRLLLVHHKIEPTKEGDAQKIIKMFEEYR